MQEFGTHTLNLRLDDVEQTAKVHHALASPIRLRILQLLFGHNYNVNEIASLLDIPASTAALNVHVLEEVGIIKTKQVPGTRGMSRVCTKMTYDVHTYLDCSIIPENKQKTYVIPIGSYTDSEIHGSYCGLASENRPIGKNLNVSSFYEPDHIYAQLLWFTYGYVEYRVPNEIARKNMLTGIRISFEACSEVAFSRMDWPSDIYVSVNGVELGTWRSPSDFGDRRGMLTPQWWASNSTQYGELKMWHVDAEGTTLDGKKLSPVVLDSLHIAEGDYFTVRIGVHEDAEYVGGLNLMGEKFGDHPQPLMVQLEYQ